MRKTLYANRGETFKLTVHATKDGSSVDLLDYNGSFYLKDRNTTDLGYNYGSVETTADGYVYITVPATETAGWPTTMTYVIAVEKDDDKTWLLSGTINVGDF